MYCFTLFAENFDSTGRSALVDMLLLGTPSLDHAETWVNALRKAIYMAPQNERIGRLYQLWRMLTKKMTKTIMITRSIA